MPQEITIEEKYERQGWPSLRRPDVRPPEGWSLPLISAVNKPHHHRLSPDGERIAFVWHREARSDIYVMSSEGGWPARLSVGRGPTVYWLDRAPRWSPDGRAVAFTRDGHVYVAPVDGAELPRNVTAMTAGAWAPVWMPDGRRLIVGAGRDDVSRLLLVDVDGGSLRALTSGEKGDDSDAQPSPDGCHAVFVRRPLDDLNRLDLRLVELESGQERGLTGTPKQKDWSPRWSPDGQSIAFLSQRSGFNEVWLVGPDGEGLRQITKLGLDVGEIAWSPNGRQLAATLNREGAFDLALIDVADGSVTDLRPGTGIHANLNWSPRGDFLTFEYEDPTRPADLYRFDLADGRLTQLTFSNPPALAAKELIIPERVRYTSYDGLEIPAFLYRPQQPNGAAVLYPHGGPTAQYSYEWDIWAQYLLAKGYTFLAPNFRGSTGYGVAFEHGNYDDWGVGDTQDCLYGARFLGGLDWIDPARIAIFGASYGGYMVACCLTRDPDYLFACGISKYGDANLNSSWALCERETRLYTEMQVGHPAHNQEVYRNASPIYEIEKMQKPVLLLHGLLDDIVPPESSEEWVEVMRRTGKTFEYKTYAGEPHGFLKLETTLDMYRRMERFLDWYLLP